MLKSRIELDWYVPIFFLCLDVDGRSTPPLSPSLEYIPHGIRTLEAVRARARRRSMSLRCKISSGHLALRRVLSHA